MRWDDTQSPLQFSLFFYFYKNSSIIFIIRVSAVLGEKVYKEQWIEK